jgi:hypothetical protein
MANAIFSSSEERLRNTKTSRGFYLDQKLPGIHFCQKLGILSRDPIPLSVNSTK